MNTIAEQWAAFEVLVMPKDAPLVQRQEMRRRFRAEARMTPNAKVSGGL